MKPLLKMFPFLEKSWKELLRSLILKATVASLFTIISVPNLCAYDFYRKQDSLALVTIYLNAGGPGWINKSGWLTTYIDSWYGVSLSTINNSVRVTGISLPNNNLTGTLFIDGLPELQVLNVRNNPLPGGSSDYSVNHKLRWIDASYTNMGMPTGIVGMTQLESLNLEGNHIACLSGAIGSCDSNLPNLGSLVNLTYLNLAGNKFTGSIPSTLGNLTNLTVLWLADNLLTGEIPTNIGNLTNLTHLSLQTNQLTGSIPPQLGNLASLVGLYLDVNQLSGSIPVQLGNLGNLKTLFLWNNQLTGNIPSALGNLIALEELALDGNQLTGSIPPELNNLVNLKFINIGANPLTGALPLNFLDNATQLEQLKIWNTNLSGDVPISCLSSPNLVWAPLYGNAFSGLPNISSLPVFSKPNGKVEVQNNFLTFEDIEPNRNLPSSKFVYGPQKEITASPVDILGGQPLNLSFTVGGSANSYQWQKNGANIPGANSNTFSKTAVLSDGGAYVLVTSNTLVPSLTIKRNVAVTVGSQTITFPAIPAKTYNNAPFKLTATASSGLPVTYVSSNPAVATVSGDVVTIEGAGTCTITAKQAGDATYSAAPDVQQLLTVNKAGQTITAGLTGMPRVAHVTFDPQGISTSGLPVTYSSGNALVAQVNGQTITTSQTGMATITLSQAGDNNFDAAPNITADLQVAAKNTPYSIILAGGDPVSQYGFNIAGIEVDGSGKLYIPTQLNQLMVLNADGSFNTVFGSTGIGDGEFNLPVDVALDATGNIFVVDRGNHRIQVFSPSGLFIRAFGGRGAASGKLSSPGGIAIDGSGKVYVMESGNNRVSVFNTNGIFQYSFGAGGTGNGEFSVARGIDVDATGKIYISDQGNSRIQIFDNAGNFLSTFGVAGAGNGEFNFAKHIKVDGSGKIYVADDSNARIQVFDNSGNHLASIAWPAAVSGVSGVTVDASGNVYGCNYNAGQVIKFSSTGTVLNTYIPIPTSGQQVFQPRGIAIDPAYNTFVSTLSGVVKVYDGLGNYQRTIGSPGAGNGQLNLPGGIVVDNTGNVFVADQNNDRVQMFDNTGAFVRVIGSGILTDPYGLALGANGNVYVTDRAGNAIYIYQPDGTPVASFGAPGSGDGQFSNPEGIAVDAAGNIYVADYSNKRVQVFNASYVYQRTIGTAGAAPGQFNGPTDVAVDASGQVYVLDFLNHNLQVFDSNGSYLYTMGSHGKGLGNFINPSKLALSNGANVLVVADRTNNRIQAFGKPDILVKKETTPITSGGSHDFGNVNMLSNSGDISFIVENSGNALLVVDVGLSTLTGPDASDFTVDLTSASSGDFKIKFTPSASGLRSAILSIASNVPSKNPYIINLQGTGVKLDQTITFGALASKTLGDAAFDLSATASSGLAVSYSTASDKVTIAGSQVTPVKAGRVTITAEQGGDTNYNTATVDQSFCINPAKPTVTANNANPEAPVLTSSAASGNQWYLNSTALNGQTSASVTVTVAGIYTVKVTVDDCASESSADQTYIVTGDVALKSMGTTEMLLYPNPVTEKLQIQWKGEQGTERHIRVFDLLGRELERHAMTGEMLILNVSHLPNGSYVVKGQQGTKVENKRFVKE